MSLVYQPPGSKLCVAACIATLAGATLEEIIKEAESIGLTPYEGLNAVGEFLLMCHLGWKNHIVMIDPRSAGVAHGRTYLATVPSLNNVGGTHRILVRPIYDEEADVWRFLVHDPNTEGLRYGQPGVAMEMDRLSVNGFFNYSELVELIGFELKFPEEYAA